MPHSMRRKARPRPFVRGVYRPDYHSPEGFPYLFAVSRDGRKIIERVIWPFEDSADVAAEVWAELNRLDPLP